jgi:hypothetical protein
MSPQEIAYAVKVVHCRDRCFRLARAMHPGKPAARLLGLDLREAVEHLCQSIVLYTDDRNYCKEGWWSGAAEEAPETVLLAFLDALLAGLNTMNAAYEQWPLAMLCTKSVCLETSALLSTEPCLQYFATLGSYPDPVKQQERRTTFATQLQHLRTQLRAWTVESVYTREALVVPPPCAFDSQPLGISPDTKFTVYTEGEPSRNLLVDILDTKSSVSAATIDE